MRSIHPSRFLIVALRADALVSAAVAALQLLFTAWLAESLQLPSALLVQTGVFLIAYANLLLWLASRARLARAWIGLVIVGNIGWALACLALGVFDGLAVNAANFADGEIVEPDGAGGPKAEKKS